ncbi:MAG TPA: hypothetical protein PLF38_09970, partial [Xylanibacter oryzae]|nr:hypothetical protein [Xylanibacter oryzae]
MTKKKSKKHNLDACLRCMHMLEDGNSFNHIHMTYGISEDRLKVLWYKYQVKGIDGLQKCKNVKSDYAFKKKIVLDIENNHLTLHSAWLKYGA